MLSLVINRVEHFKIELDESENNGKKKKSSHFGELLDEIVNKIWSVYRCCINIVYISCKDFLKVDVRIQ